jgi:CHAT domain-containing protein
MKNKFLFSLLFLSILILTASKGWAINSFDDTSRTALISSPLNTAYLLAQDGGNSEGTGNEDDGEGSAETDAMTAEMMASYSETENLSREGVARDLQTGRWDQALNELENTWEQDLQAFYGSDTSVRNISLGQLQQALGSLDQQTGQKSAIVYLASRQDALEVLLVTADAAPARHSIPEAKREIVFKTAGQLLIQISRKERTIGRAYLTPAKQLYQWIMAPLVPQLDRQKVNNLIFVSDYGLRSIPMAVLHDGQQFLVEKYSIATSPNFSMINPKFKSIRNSQVLAMGASTFTNQNPLPAVPIELRLITQDLGGGLSFLNQPFTISNLISQRQQQPFEIVHLATHADFNSGSPDRSYIQFFDGQLFLNDLSKLGLSDPPVQLLVISACQSAVGNKNAELGFAGLALKSGVATVVASLWYVSDEGTLALMNEFYRQLRTAPIKAEALRQAQIAMIKGNMQIENGQLVTNQANYQTRIPLPIELASLNVRNLSHPYYWSAFTMIGSPW